MGCGSVNPDETPITKTVRSSQDELDRNIYMLEIEKQQLWNDYNRLKNSGNEQAALIKLTNFNQVIAKLNQFNAQKAMVENNELKAKIAKGETKVIDRLQNHAGNMKDDMPTIDPDKYKEIGEHINLENKYYDKNNLKVF